MIAKVRKIIRLDYARVQRLTLETEAGEMEVEIPDKILREAGFAPSEGGIVEVETSKEAGSIEEWDIVMGGEVYFKTSSPSRVYASLGGLQLVLKGEKDSERFQAGDKIYVKLRSPRSR